MFTKLKKILTSIIIFLFILSSTYLIGYSYGFSDANIQNENSTKIIYNSSCYNNSSKFMASIPNTYTETHVETESFLTYIETVSFVTQTPVTFKFTNKNNTTKVGR